LSPAPPLSAQNRWERALRFFERTSASTISGRWAITAAVLIYFALTALLASRRLWHDELYTFYIATAPTLSRLWQEIHLDLNPPLEYLAVRVFTGMLGHGTYAVRLPSILAFLLGSLCLYRFAAIRISAWYGMLAMLVLWASPFFYYATEARPYALAIGFLGLTLLLWQRATEEERSTISVWLLCAAVSAMMLSHIMSVLYVAPFCLAEAFRTYRRRRIDGRMWLALLLPCAIPFIYTHLMSRFESSAFPPIFQASARKIAETYYGSLKLEALPLLLAIGLAELVIPRSTPEEKKRAQAPKAVDLVLIAGLLAIPALVNLILMCVHGAYFDRYAFPVAFGYALSITYFLARQTNGSRTAAIAASAVLLLFVCAFNLGPGLRQSVWGRRAEAGAKRAIDQIRPDLPLVAASGLTFLEMDHYGDPQTVARLYYLTDRRLALHYAGATIFEGMPALKQYFPIRANVAPFDQFTAEHKSFLVLGTPEYPEDWLLRALVDTKAEIRYLSDLPGPYKDTQLYLVAIGY